MRVKLFVRTVGIIGILVFVLALILKPCSHKTDKQTTKSIQATDSVLATMQPTETDTPQETEKKESADMRLNTQDCYCLAKIAMAEAENQDTEGKALVMLVVLNRVKSAGFPDSVRKVIYQNGQFSPVSNGRYDSVEPDKDCWMALDMVQNGWNESRGALYFESKSDSTWHEDNLQFLFKHGEHYFYTE